MMRLPVCPAIRFHGCCTGRMGDGPEGYQARYSGREENHHIPPGQAGYQKQAKPLGPASLPDP